MYCSHCGNELPENANFCPECGNFTTTGAGTTTITVDPMIDAKAAQEKDDLGGSILKFSILGLAFGCSGFLALLGIIFTAIAKKKVRAYIAKFGETEGRATVGKILTIPGLIVSIFFTVFFALYFLIFGIAIGAVLAGTAAAAFII